MKEYKLTKLDKKWLIYYGYKEDEMKWLEQAANACVYEYIGKRKQEKITRERSIQLIGKRAWLSGIARACFHMTAARPTKYANAHGDPYVLFTNTKF